MSSYHHEPSEEDDATHIKISYGPQLVATFANDGIDKEIPCEVDGVVKFKIVYKNRKCYMHRVDWADPQPQP